MSRESQRDSGERPLLAIQSLPLGINDYAYGSGSAGSGVSLTFNVTTIPDDSRLSLWDQLFSIYVDVDDAAHLFPSGSSMTAELLSIRITHWVDWAGSSDQTNTRKHIIRVENYGASTHTYYIRYKAYSFASAGGNV